MVGYPLTWNSLAIPVNGIAGCDRFTNKKVQSRHHPTQQLYRRRLQHEPLTGVGAAIWFSDVNGWSKTSKLRSDLIPNIVQLPTEVTPGCVELEKDKTQCEKEQTCLDTLSLWSPHLETYFNEPDIINSSRLQEAVQHSQCWLLIHQNINFRLDPADQVGSRHSRGKKETSHLSSSSSTKAETDTSRSAETSERQSTTRIHWWTTFLSPRSPT